MRRVCMLAALAAGLLLSARGDTPDAGAELKVQLSDGSCIIGKPSIGGIKITTDYANLNVPIAMLSELELSASGHTVRASLRNGDRLQGQWGEKEIGMKTIFGPVNIPVAEMRSFTVLLSGSGQALPSGLVLHYGFHTDEGDRVTDESGNGNDGSVHGVNFSQDEKGRGAVRLDGNGEFVALGNPASLQLQDFTIAAWIKRGSVNRASGDGADAVLFGYGNGGYFLGIHPYGGLFLSKIDFDHVDADCRVTDGEFHHVAVTKKGGQVIFYLDGTAYPAADYNPGFVFTTNAAAGARDDTQGCGFIGSIGELEVFNRALSGNEIEGIYNAQK